MAVKLMEYKYTIEHRSGRVHSNVDPLSRNPDPTPPTAKDIELDELPDAVGFPPQVLMANASDKEPDPEMDLGMSGNDAYPCWIGRPRTPPLEALFDPTRHTRGYIPVYPITLDTLPPADRAYRDNMAASREPRPSMSSSSSERNVTLRTRDGSIQEGSGFGGPLSGPPKEEILDPQESDESKESEEAFPTREEKESPPSSPTYKYQNEENDFDGLEPILDEHSFALRVSGKFRLEGLGETGQQEENPPRLDIVELPCQCLGADEKGWDNELPLDKEGSANDETKRPLEERWEDEELIKALLCSEELSSEADETESRTSEEVDSPSKTCPPTIE
jgi:hypothetical protein